MNTKCVKNCEFLINDQVSSKPPACIFYGLYLDINNDIIYRCKECIDDEKKWAIEQTIKEVGNGFIQI